MKHEHPKVSEAPDLEAPAPVVRWHVYNASRQLVATYSEEAAAAAHVACWPALYYSAGSSGPLLVPGGSSAPS